MGLIDDMKTLIPKDAAKASSIFLGSYPDKPDDILTLYQTGGSDPDHAYGHRSFENPSLQVRVRNKSYPKANDIIEAIKDKLDGLTSFKANGNHYISIMQQGDLLPLGRDDNGRTELSLNFRVRVERK